MALREEGPVAVPGGPVLSVVTPAYNEAGNLPLLYDRLCGVLSSLALEWEWVVVDDHSGDSTFPVVSGIAERDPRVRGVRFARNCGSHAAMMCGMELAQGKCAVLMAADLQDPPESLPTLIKEWQADAQVVWAVRARREGEKRSTLLFSRLYYFLMQRFVGIKEMPGTGADFFLVDRRVLDALCQFQERNASILALVTWMGFRQAAITYDKQVRFHGQSGWTLRKKLKMVVDSVTSFSYLPIRMMSYAGLITAITGFGYACFTIVNALARRPIEGWSSLMVVVLVVGGMQMLMLGVLGEYLWRALDESRRRPRYLIEAATPANDPARTWQHADKI